MAEAPSAEGTPTPTGTVRFGILGAAAIAPVALVHPARDVDRATVAVVAARNLERAQAFAAKHAIPRVDRDYQAVLDDPGVDAVYNPLPNGLHGVWTRRALDAGKHVLCEKPFTANASEAAEVAAHAASTDRVVMEAFHWRYHPMAQRMIDVVTSGEIGALEHVEASLCIPLFKPGDIRFDPDLAGGSLMDLGCYVVNMVRAVASTEPEVIDAEAKLTKRGVDRWVHGRLRFPDGVTGEITCALASANLLSLHIHVRGSKGEMHVRNPMRPKLFGAISVRTAGRRRTIHPPRTDTYRHQLEAFVAAVLDGKPFPSTAEDAVRNMTVIDSLYRAAGLEPRQPTPA